MSWIPSDAESHTHKANTPARQQLWAKVANRTLAMLQRHDTPNAEAQAIRAANQAVDRAIEARRRMAGP